MERDVVRILAVDDVPENLAALDALLQQDGVELLTARSGVEALELLLIHDVALALLDVQMPGMDGFELAEFMRGTERTRRVPIIFLTAVATDERRKFRGYEAGAVDYLLKPLDAQILRNKVAVFIELYRQRRELAQQRDDHAAALARLRAHSDNSPLAIVEIDHRQRIIAWSKGAERMFGWRSAEVCGFGASQVQWPSPASASDFDALMKAMIADDANRETRLLRFVTAEGYTLDCECYCSALRNEAGRLISVNLQILNVTDRMRAEETQRLLVGELNHRVKNTLASVQAIAQQSLRRSTGPSDFAPTFLGRIHALANAHSLLSSATWQGARLADLIAGQTAIGAFSADRFLTSGPDVELPPEPALHLALVLHELVTNAHKYGALSQSSGTVSLNWHVADNMLEMDWIERGGPPAAAASHRGFGTALIERSLQADGGNAVATYGAEGIHWRMTLPYLATPRPGMEREQPVELAPQPETAEPAGSEMILSGQSILVVEDEPLLAMELTGIIEDGGGSIAAIASDTNSAMRCIDRTDIAAALLDGNLHGEPVGPVADALRDRGIPFIFVSGYGRENLPAGHDQAPLVGKPFDARQVLNSLANVLEGAEPESA
ncbi:response regulator [Altererythrobacter xixiisoli]|uniref:histidine kinase n=1 Tax=Croceibacterium xixiisoli TaxID=1476466 RepID=A0A6I4TWY6_9SPHN|nr:response regulator [Croceibacterium xixiisoli]MXO99158.1 response regulator [Croceibacterium xixiisoli]